MGEGLQRAVAAARATRNAAPTVIITQEYITKLLEGDLRIYLLRGERAAMRAALGDAAALCDMLAKAVVDQNGRTTIAIREMSATFKRCGDEIWRLREQIDVPDGSGPATGYERAGGFNAS